MKKDFEVIAVDLSEDMLLSAREKQIMEMRYGLHGKAEKTQKEVADILGISQSYISRLEKRIIEKLKKELANFPL